MRIERVYCRDDPIPTMASPMRPPSDFSFSKCVMKSGMIWDEIDACRPFEWRAEFAPVARASQELRDAVREKYSAVLSAFEGRVGAE